MCWNCDKFLISRARSFLQIFLGRFLHCLFREERYEGAYWITCRYGAGFLQSRCNSMWRNIAEKTRRHHVTPARATSAHGCAARDNLKSNSQQLFREKASTHEVFLYTQPCKYQKHTLIHLNGHETRYGRFRNNADHEKMLKMYVLYTAGRNNKVIQTCTRFEQHSPRAYENTASQYFGS